MAKPKSLPPPQKLPDFSFFQALRPTRRAFCFALENEKGRFQNDEPHPDCWTEEIQIR